MKLRYLFAAAWLGGAASLWALEPVNPSASASARQVLKYINDMQAAGFIISGQQIGYEPFVVTDVSSKPAGESEYARVQNITGGKIPALLAFDWDTCYTSPERRASIIKLAKDHWAAGGLVSFSWHEARPLQSSPDAAFGSPNNSMSQLTNAEWVDLLTNPASAIRQNWEFHVETIASYLKQLRDAGVVVLWRPYHEVDGFNGTGWFWWNSNGMNNGDQYKQLWQMLYNRLTNFHGLNNLLWVYAPVQAYNSFYPAGYVDFGGHDYYATSPNDVKFFERSYQIASMLGGRTVALTETGMLPSADLLADARYAWVTIWYGKYLDKNYYGEPNQADGNTAAQVAAFYANPRVVDRANYKTAFNAPVVTAKARIKTGKTKYVLRGTASGLNVNQVQAKIRGVKKMQKATGTGNWSLKLKLIKKKTVVVVSAVDGLGRISPGTKVTIVQK